VRISTAQRSFVIVVGLLGLALVNVVFRLAGDQQLRTLGEYQKEADLAQARFAGITYLASELAWAGEERGRELRASLQTEIFDFQSTINGLGDKLDGLRRGSLVLGVYAPEQLDQAAAAWRQVSTQWGPFNQTLQRLRETTTPAAATAILAEPSFDQQRLAAQDSLNGAARALAEAAGQAADRASVYQFWVLLFMVVGLGWASTISRSVTNRIGNLYTTAQEVSSGNLRARASTAGRDEIAALGEVFNQMTGHIEQQLQIEREARARLEEVLAALRQTAEQLGQVSADILTATSEQSAGMAQEAAAVRQTSVTVEELRQMAALSAQNASMVALLAQQSVEVSQGGKDAVERTVGGMENIREQVQSIAASMQRLSEQAQAVGEIIATVQDLAEQSNLLAVNASIEAARAGEHGYGFAVVANEVRSLAEQSRQATVQVRSILGEIQKSVQAALQITHVGSRSVDTGMDLVHRAGEVIRSLADTINRAAEAASHIRASADQNATGVEQIAQAIGSIHEASLKNLEGTRQAERAARDLNELSLRLRALLRGDGRVA
jgi:methyl-accepting chemotaxis protein